MNNGGGINSNKKSGSKEEEEEQDGLSVHSPCKAPNSSTSSLRKEQSQVDLELKLLEALEIYPPIKLRGIHRHFVLYGLTEYMRRSFNRQFSASDVLQMLDRFYNLEMLANVYMTYLPCDDPTSEGHVANPPSKLVSYSECVWFVQSLINIITSNSHSRKFQEISSAYACVRTHLPPPTTKDIATTVSDPNIAGCAQWRI
uniref:Chromatin modification-related protein EAF7/MRGBP n=1 Tax=Tanacetum cinerariifolium TaxID=118510 RepID=A0A6L2KXH5_TANCI|nr:chromatin modification-related protein EAF7/MRGBP [Tanacetum cinerariifolium]